MDARSDDENTRKSVLVEHNNNVEDGTPWAINVSRKSPEIPEVSAPEDKSDVVRNRFEKQRSLQDLIGKKKTESNIPVFQRGRSNSDGATILLNENAEAFPSLPNTVLEKLGLYGDVTRERLNEESLEQKFTSLTLAFTIDARTIEDRRERQRRNRDQTESNFSLEVEKLKEKLALLKPLCTNFETADLLSTLFSQVETLTRAASLVSIAAERFGAVQHEERLTESVQLMLCHVQALKQQRDSARRQLQYTKRVLQEPVQQSALGSMSQKTFYGVNKKLIGRRRASTDSVNLNNQQIEQNFKLNRRISDLSFRASLAKNRPSRLDLGMELNKIREISSDEGCKDENSKFIESPNIEVAREEIDSDFEVNGQVASSLKQPICENNFINEMSAVLRLKFSTYREEIQRQCVLVFKKWSENGYLHAFLNSCAILCFSVSILTLVGIFLEQDYTKPPRNWLFPWLK